MGSRRLTLRRSILTAHRWVALIACAFILVFGVTGSIMAFEPELENVLHAKVAYVRPGAGVRSLAEIGDAVTRARAGARIIGYTIPASRRLAYQVIETDSIVFVDPATARIQGTRSLGPDLLAEIHQLHLRLLIRNRGDTGKRIMSWAGLALLLLLLSGLYLWWPLKRFTIRRTGSTTRKWLDLHAASGILSFVFLLVLAITGVIIGFERVTTPTLYRLTGTEPSQRPSQVMVPEAGTVISADSAMAIAAAALPGAAVYNIAVPGHPESPYVVRLRFPEDRTPGGRSEVRLDPYTGAVLFAEGSRTAPAGTRLITANRAFHTGDRFGLPGKAAVSLASLVVVVQAISGLVLWWRRRST